MERDMGLDESFFDNRQDRQNVLAGSHFRDHAAVPGVHLHLGCNRRAQ